MHIDKTLSAINSLSSHKEKGASESKNIFKNILKEGKTLEKDVASMIMEHGNIEKIAPLMAQHAINFEYHTKLLSTALSSYKALTNIQM
jgi:hypothetical protein